MADTAIEKFDPSQLMQGVRDRIKSTFVSLIPEAQWDQLVKKEIDDFFAERVAYGRQREWNKMSDFSKVCFEEFEKQTRVKVSDMMAEYKTTLWENGGPVMNDELKKLLTENASTMFTAIIGSMFQTAINNMPRYN